MALFTPPHLLDGHRWRGMRVGLLGGSFNPPHAGHLHVSTTALKYLQLDCVWWLVTPQNPLKAETGLYEERLAQCRALTRHHPRLVVSDLEKQIQTNRSVETITILKKRFPETAFVFLAGTDILPQLDRWHRWRTLPELVSIAFVARPPAVELVRNSRFRLLRLENRFLAHGQKPALLPEKIFWMLREEMHGESSTKIRNFK